MAWSSVQATNAANSAGTITVTLTGVTAGNLLTVQCAYYRGATNSTTPPAISDTNGALLPASVPNAINPVLGGDSGGSAIWYEKAAASGTHTVTITLDGSSAGHALLTEWSGGDGTLDQPSFSGTAASTTQSRATGTTAGLTEAADLSLIALVLGSGAGVANASITDPPSGYTSQLAQQNTTSDVGLEFASQFLATQAPQSSSWTWTDATTLFSQGTIATFLQTSLNSGIGPNLGVVGPGKLNLPPRSSDARTSLFVPPPLPTMNLRLIGPGKLTLPPRDYGQPSASTFTPATLGLITPPGPGISPNAMLQFQSPPRSTSIIGTVAPMAGLAATHSVTYGLVFPAPAILGFIPQPGPGVGPFSNNQFQGQIAAFSSPPSAGTLDLSPGASISVSVTYADLAGSIGTMAGQAVTHSVTFGNGGTITAGTIPGIAVSVSLAYGAMTGLGLTGGQAASSSLALVTGIGANFQPFIPMTATTDVRLRIGYQPWKVGKSDTIG